MTDESDQSDAGGDAVPVDVSSGDRSSTRDRLEESAERAIEELDRGIVELLHWLLETDTRSRIYVHLRTDPGSTSEEIAEGTGLYPSTVREALAELHDEGIVERDKRVNEGAGNNPYEYRAIPPSDLVGEMVTTVQDQLNRLVNLDTYLRGEEPTSETEPINISVDEPPADDDQTDRSDEPDDHPPSDDRR